MCVLKRLRRAVQLEDLMVLEAPRHLQSTLLAQLAAALASRHPPPAIPRDFPPSFKGCARPTQDTPLHCMNQPGQREREGEEAATGLSLIHI
eukprot:1773818-Rhodomonas_salina.3